MNGKKSDQVEGNRNLKSRRQAAKGAGLSDHQYREEMKRYARLVAGANFRPGDQVKMGDNPTVLTVVENGDPLVRLVTPHGQEIRAGWRTLSPLDEEREK